MGGRGASYSTPSNGKWSKGMGDKISDTLKGAIGKQGKPLSVGPCGCAR